MLDSESTEEVKEDWVSRLFKAAEEEDSEPASPPSDKKKKKKKAPKAKAKARATKGNEVGLRMQDFFT